MARAPQRRTPQTVRLLPGRARQPGAPDELRRGAALLDYSRGGNRAYDIASILRDYLVRVEPDSDELLLGKAFFVVAGRRVADSFFLIERYRHSPTPRRSPTGEYPAANQATTASRVGLPAVEAWFAFFHEGLGGLAVVFGEPGVHVVGHLQVHAVSKLAGRRPG